MTQEGKSLLELIVVLAVIGIVSGMAGPSLLGLYSRTQMRAATEEIASELRLAKQLAATHHDRVRVTFDVERRALHTQFVNGAKTHHVYEYASKGIVIDEPSTGPEILFHPSGRSATATTIRVHGREGQMRKLTVGITGRVAIQ